MNFFDLAVIIGAAVCGRDRFHDRPVAQRGHHFGLSDRDAARGRGARDDRAPLATLPASPFPPNGVLLFGLFLAIGVILGKMARTMLDDTMGAEIGIGDRLGGALLGAVRVGLVVTTLVLVFDQLVPLARQPQFLNGSQLRPLFSAAGQAGFRSLPPEATMAIERLRREQRI